MNLKSIATSLRINNTFVNLLGTHLVRVFLSRLAYLIRRVSFEGVKKNCEEDFVNNGYLVINNFLDHNEYQQIKESCEEIVSSGGWDINQQEGATKIELKRLYLGKNGINLSKLDQIIKNCTHKNDINDLRLYFQNSCRLEESVAGTTDNNQYFHRDKYYPQLKFWYFIDDLKYGDGCFEYVKGSNRLSLKKILYEYVFSIKPEKVYIKKDLAHEKLIPRKNTLVVADTNGFHRRGFFKKGSKRRAIHGVVDIFPFRFYP